MGDFSPPRTRGFSPIKVAFSGEEGIFIVIAGSFRNQTMETDKKMSGKLRIGIVGTGRRGTACFGKLLSKRNFQNLLMIYVQYKLNQFLFFQD